MIFSPQDAADKFNFNALFASFMREHEKEFSVDGVYWPTIDPTDNWSRRKFFAESIGAKILKYVPVEYPPDAVF